jgi:hypothetical protein
MTAKSFLENHNSIQLCRVAFSGKVIESEKKRSRSGAGYRGELSATY